jgi:FtsP/CotA-like multicopper oxidase with cupredoxin domain
MNVSRRNFLKIAGVVAGSSLLSATSANAIDEQMSHSMGGAADYTIRIGASPIEIAPNRIISTTTYNDQFPGPLLRFKEGQLVTVDIHNNTDAPEQLHWHGQVLGVDVDGAAEEGTPYIPAHGKRRIQFTPGPSGLRFYHTHNRAGGEFVGWPVQRGSWTSVH